MHICAVTHRGHVKALNALELKLQAIGSYPVWVPGTELGSSGRMAVPSSQSPE